MAELKPTFLMSHPGPSWRIRGGTNFRSETRKVTNPRKAALEWLGLADAITKAGGSVVVLPPPAVEPALTGMLYTANAGALFHDGYVVSRMWAKHRVAEAEPIHAHVSRWGVPVTQAKHTWEGQAEIATLQSPRNGAGGTFILTYGVRSDEESIAEVRERLPREARVLEVQIRDPYFHGDTCLAAFTTPKGPVLLACEAALVSHDLAALAKFATGTQVIAVTEADALAYACNALAVGDQWLVPKGVSQALRTQIAGLGMTLVELDLSEVFGKGGGGPRCMVNDLTIAAPAPRIPDADRFEARRAELAARFAAYPETPPEA